jgi:hypothetical protein
MVEMWNPLTLGGKGRRVLLFSFFPFCFVSRAIPSAKQRKVGDTERDYAAPCSRGVSRSRWVGAESSVRSTATRSCVPALTGPTFSNVGHSDCMLFTVEKNSTTIKQCDHLTMVYFCDRFLCGYVCLAVQIILALAGPERNTLVISWDRYVRVLLTKLA